MANWMCEYNLTKAFTGAREASFLSFPQSIVRVRSSQMLGALQRYGKHNKNQR
jgi:hypothetical protein